MIAAEQADVVVMCLGLDATIEGEEGDAGNEYASGDKPSLRLPGLQQELLEKVSGSTRRKSCRRVDFRRLFSIRKASCDIL